MKAVLYRLFTFNACAARQYRQNVLCLACRPIVIAVLQLLMHRLADKTTQWPTLLHFLIEFDSRSCWQQNTIHTNHVCKQKHVKTFIEYTMAPLKRD